MLPFFRRRVLAFWHEVLRPLEEPRKKLENGCYRVVVSLVSCWYLFFSPSHHLYTSSKGLVSEKHESQTSLTVFTACTSSLTHGLAIMECTARRLTQSWNCCVTLQLFRVQNSLVNLHSPLSIDARICLPVC